MLKLKKEHLRMIKRWKGLDIVPLRKKYRPTRNHRGFYVDEVLSEYSDYDVKLIHALVFDSDTILVRDLRYIGLYIEDMEFEEIEQLYDQRKSIKLTTSLCNEIMAFDTCGDFSSNARTLIEYGIIEARRRKQLAEKEEMKKNRLTTFKESGTISIK